MSNRRSLSVGAAVCLLFLGACSGGNDSAEKTVSRENAAAVRDEAARKKEIARNLAALPERPTGRVDLAGGRTASITTQAADDYSSSGATTQVEIGTDGVLQGFADLCSGKVDLVDSIRHISKKELAACQDNGLDVVQFQVASDALVLAIKAESDVGGDCIDLEQVRTMFRAGSPYTSWRQLKFADQPLVITGPSVEAAGFGLFGDLGLDRANAVLSDLRSDYRAHDNELDTLTDVIGTKDDIEQAAYLSSRKQAVTALRKEAAAARTTLAEAEAEVTAAEEDRQKGIADGRSAAQQAKDQARQDDAYPVRDDALVAYNALKADVKDAESAAKKSARAQRHLAARQGRVGLFQFDYYELEKEQLRPFEISTEGATDCIFPSQRTVSEGQYPLSRPVLVTTTTRSLERGEVKDFMTTYLDQATKLATSAALVAPTADIIAEQRAWATGEKKPTLFSLDGTAGDASSSPGPAR